MRYTTLLCIAIIALPTSAEWQRVTEHAPWSPRSGVVAVTYNGRLWLIGGGPVLGGEIWSTTDGLTWIRHGDNKHIGHESIVYRERIITFSGDPYATTDGVTFERLANDVGTWSWSGYVCHARRLWCLGGGNAHIMSSPDGATWTTHTRDAPWGWRADPALAVFKGHVWMVGGAGVSSPTNDLWASPDGLNWSRIFEHAAWAPRTEQALLVADNQLWMFGGRQYISRTDVIEYNDVWSSPDGGLWIEETPSAPWEPRHDFVATVYDGKIWLMGGMAYQVGEYNDIWVYPLESAAGRSWCAYR